MDRREQLSESVSRQLPEFRMRRYGKSELAMLYFPESDPAVACRALRRWILRCPAAREALRELGHCKHGKFFFEAGGGGHRGCTGGTVGEMLNS